MKNFFLNLNISRKIGVVFLILLVMMGIGGSIGLYNAKQIARFSAVLYGDYFKRLETLSIIERELLIIRQDVFRHITASARGAKAFLYDSIMERDKNVDNLIKEHIASEEGRQSEEEEKLYKSFEDALRGYMEVRTKVLALSEGNKEKDAVALANGDGAGKFGITINSLKALIDEEKDLISREYQKSEYSARMITVVTMVAAIAAVVFSMGLWIILTRLIVNPITMLEASAEKIAQGNLKERTPPLGEDEIGKLAMEFNTMAENLEEHYASLEKKVEDRTMEFMKANEVLFRNKHELEVLNEELINANRMKSQFLANISHELRTPLNSIIGFSELLHERSFGDLNQKQFQYVEYIHGSGRHLLDLINNILDLSKIEAGKVELHSEEFELAEVLGDILGTIKPIAAKKDVIVESKDIKVSQIIKADKSKIKQIMLNLLSNAVKFNKKGGRVDVDWNIVEDKGGRSILVSVKDTGIGIKKEDFPKVFREFEQIDASITREYGGTGLGLALTKKLVELHGGRIWLESEAGKGTQISFVLPQEIAAEEAVYKKAEEMPAPKVSRIIEEESPPLILVAGESPDINELLKEYLVSAGYNVHTASDGIEVISKAKELMPFAIALGIKIPKKDGWEVIKELKETPETSNIPVIIVSSSNNKELGFSLGAVDHLTKPVDKNKLLESLGRLSLVSSIKRRPFTILAIDDEPQVLELIGDLLEKQGFGVLKAAGGEEGIKLAIEKEPDIIILDLMMPQVSGFDVVERLKTHPIAKDIPIIIFTAKDITEDDKLKLGDNIDHLLKKAGFSKDDLLNEIKKLEMVYPAKARMIDALTGTFNQRYFNRWIAGEISRSERHGQPFSMLMLDIDNMNDYNLKNGIVMGNEALAMTARIIEDNVRKADCIIRYADDAFLIVLTGTAKVSAASVGEKLRARIANSSFPALGGRKNGKITVSIGITSFPVDGKSIKELVEKVSEAESGAFEKGGNMVVVFGG